MNKEKQVLFYVGAAVYFDLESDEVDTILDNVGLSMEDNTDIECREAIRAHFPERYEFVHGMRPY